MCAKSVGWVSLSHFLHRLTDGPYSQYSGGAVQTKSRLIMVKVSWFVMNTVTVTVNRVVEVVKRKGVESCVGDVEGEREKKGESS